MNNLPNILSIARLALLPVIIWLFFMEAHWGAKAVWLCFILYAIGAITDWLDGYLARKMKIVSDFGTFFDPISDKIFVASMLVLLVGFERLPGLWMVPVLVILAREFLISGLREYLGPRNIQVPVMKLAKWKTAVQMIAIGLLVIGPYAPYTLESGRWGLAIAALLTVITGWGYMKAGLDHLRKMA